MCLGSSFPDAPPLCGCCQRSERSAANEVVLRKGHSCSEAALRRQGPCHFPSPFLLLRTTRTHTLSPRTRARVWPENRERVCQEERQGSSLDRQRWKSPGRGRDAIDGRRSGWLFARCQRRRGVASSPGRALPSSPPNEAQLRTLLSAAILLASRLLPPAALSRAQTEPQSSGLGVRARSFPVRICETFSSWASGVRLGVGVLSAAFSAAIVSLGELNLGIATGSKRTRTSHDKGGGENRVASCLAPHLRGSLVLSFIFSFFSRVRAFLDGLE